MNDMTSESQDPHPQAGAEAPAAAPAPKRRRTTRKVEPTSEATTEVAAEPVAVAAAEPQPVAVPEVAPEAPVKPRRARKTAAAPTAAEVVVAPVEAPIAASVEAAVPPADVEPAAPAKRAPRSRKKVVAAEVSTDAVVTEVVAAEPAPVAAQEVPAVAAEAAPVAEAGARAEGQGDDQGEAQGERRRERGRRRGRRGEGGERAVGEGAAAEEAAPAIFTLGGAPEEGAAAEPALPRVDAQTRFSDVVTGNYDSEGEVAPDEDPGKRVLRPEPEAPKLHKVLAQAGIGSRRDMEQLIEQGQVTVNGEVAHVGMRIARGDQIKLAGKPIKVRIAPPPARIVAYHKPVGEVVTHHDPEGRPTVFRHLPRLPNGKWLSVGRLDINTEGLLLFTNSGDLANQLMHPRFGVEREYAVRVLGMLDEVARDKLLTGVEIEGQAAAFKSIEDGGGEGANHWYRVVITEGRNREVRKLFESVGMAVSRLIRIRYGTVVLPRGLKRGVWVELDDEDVRQIRRLAGNDQGPRGEQGARGESRGERPERGERSDKGRGRGAQHGGGGPKGAQQGQQGGGQGGQGGRGPGQGGQGQQGQGKPRGKGQGQGKFGGGNGGQPGQFERDQTRDPREQTREPRDQRETRGDDYDDDIPLRIPNPLEQTFDRRFATGSKRIVSGFGRPSDQDTRSGPEPRRKGEPKQPDPMQTSVGYIGADAYFGRPGGGQGKNRGGGRRR
jgi:23S rRNA pseudouridine2605 synthase